MKNKFINPIREQAETGFTLVEMLVAMTIAAVFFTAFTAVVVATMQTMRTGDQRTVAQQNARIAMNFLADEIKQMSELEAPSFTEYRDPLTGGLPRNGTVVDANNNDVYPILRRSTDGSSTGYINLDHEDAPGGNWEYEDFRDTDAGGPDDGMSFDVRPLFPNKINFLINQSSFYPSTLYSSLNPDLPLGTVDLDGTAAAFNNPDNFQSAPTRITYEQQKQPPRTGLLPDEGAMKNLYLTIFGGNGGGVNFPNKPFVLLRSFEIGNVTGGGPNNYAFNETMKFYDLTDPDGVSLGVNLPTPAPDLRQIVADHILDMRFRYFHVRGGEWIEIRYDPYTDHVGGGGTGTNDGYYRYYDAHGEEIHIWADPDGNSITIPTTDIVEEYESMSEGWWVFMPASEYERGQLLFEGWRFVNTVMITVKGANQELQQTYFETIATEFSNQSGPSYNINHPDFGLGFVDFQQGGDYLSDADGLNSSNPLWHAVDSYREGVSPTPTDQLDPSAGAYTFDFVEPNSNPNYDPGRFVTLQTMVAPPILKVSAQRAVSRLTYGLSYV